MTNWVLAWYLRLVSPAVFARLCIKVGGGLARRVVDRLFLTAKNVGSV